LAGLFYKIHMTRDRGDRNQGSTLREYPVFLAWQIAAKPRLGGGGATVLGVFLVAGLALLVGFVVLKKYLRQIRKGDQPAVRYRPLRDTLRAEAAAALAAAEEGDAPEDTEPQDTEVDPLLKQAAEEYRREKKQEREQADGEDGSG
jgi:hypothetical protein